MRLYEIGAATRADADRNVANDNWPLVLTRSQAAAVIGISVSTFDGWVRKGILPAPIAGTRAVEPRHDRRCASNGTQRAKPRA
jgi:predicted DNA-binding transcriptional regulator AlpA